MNRLLQLIDDIEEFFEQCNTLPFTNKVVVDKEDLYELTTELRLKIPDVIKKAERTLDEKERIIQEAKEAAESMEKEAEGKIVALVNEHEIIQQAYEKAQEVLEQAKIDAQEMRISAISYIDDKLVDLQKISEQVRDLLNKNYESVYGEISNYIETIKSNREELSMPAAAIENEE